MRGAPRSAFPEVSPLLTIDPSSINYTEVHPAGLFEMIALVHERYSLPVIITENNGQQVPAGDLDLESQLVVENVSWMMRALDAGYDVRGYFYWSLMDNYEWNMGMTGKRLGLYAVEANDPNKRRQPRPVANTFSELARQGGVPERLAERFPIFESSLRE